MRDNTKEIDLPDFYYDYIIGMINEEIPRSEQELFDLVGEFLMNGGRLSQSEAQGRCGIILAALVGGEIIKLDKTENRLTHAAEKLEKAVILNELDIMDGNDIN